MKDEIREAIRGVFELTIQNIWGGFFWLIFGTYAIWSLYRQRKEKNIWNDPMYGFGWIGAIMMFITSIVVIYWLLTGGVPE